MSWTLCSTKLINQGKPIIGMVKKLAFKRWSMIWLHATVVNILSLARPLTHSSLDHSIIHSLTDTPIDGWMNWTGREAMVPLSATASVGEHTHSPVLLVRRCWWIVSALGERIYKYTNMSIPLLIVVLYYYYYWSIDWLCSILFVCFCILLLSILFYAYNPSHCKCHSHSLTHTLTHKTLVARHDHGRAVWFLPGPCTLTQTNSKTSGHDDDDLMLNQSPNVTSHFFSTSSTRSMTTTTMVVNANGQYSAVQDGLLDDHKSTATLRHKLIHSHTHTRQNDSFCTLLCLLLFLFFFIFLCFFFSSLWSLIFKY